MEELVDELLREDDRNLLSVRVRCWGAAIRVLGDNERLVGLNDQFRRPNVTTAYY